MTTSGLDEQPAKTSVQRCVNSVRHMILVGELLPGETLRQVALAEQLGVSRIPLREALASLEADGVVTYTPRIGYAVARLDSEELTEIYLMRRLLEAELLRTVDWAEVDLERLVELNDQLDAIPIDDLVDGKRLNREFHFYLFSLSPLSLVQREVNRLWKMSELYRSIYLYEEGIRPQVVIEHRRIIAAIAAKDTEAVLAEINDHRHHAELVVTARLGHPAR